MRRAHHGTDGGPPDSGAIHADDDDLGRLVTHWRQLAEQAADMRERVARLAEDTGMRAAQAVAAEALARAAEDLGQARRLGTSLANALHADLRALSHSRDNYQRAERDVSRAIIEIRHGLYAGAAGAAENNLIRGVLAGRHDTTHAHHHEPARPPTERHPPAAAPVPSPVVGDRRAVVIARARQWVDDDVGYNQHGSYDGYRTDCSGFVSMAWGLPESLTTSSLPDVCHPISAEDLRAGDVLLDTAPGSAGHVVLFDRWTNADHTGYLGYELCPGGMRHHVVPYPYFAGHGSFRPYRYDAFG